MAPTVLVTAVMTGKTEILLFTCIHKAQMRSEKLGVMSLEHREGRGLRGHGRGLLPSPSILRPMDSLPQLPRKRRARERTFESGNPIPAF